VSIELDRAAVERAIPEGVATSVGEGWLDLAIGGGEDFALMATVAPELVEGVVRGVAEAGETTGGVIGRVVAAAPDGPAVWLVEGDTRRRIDHLGYDHG
jgi:thiamine monophosphate kinase